MSMPSRVRGYPCVLALLLLAACTAFEPTIPDRQADPGRPIGQLQVAQPYQSEPRPRSQASSTGPASYERLDDPMPRVAGDDLIQLELRQTSLAQAIHLVAERARVSLYLDATLDREIDVSFRDVTLDAALQVMLERNGLRLVEGPPGIFWVQRDDGSESLVAHFRVQNIPVAPLAAVLEPLVSEAAEIVVDPKQNLVVVKGTRLDADIVAGFLEHADHLQRQVLIEVRIVEVRLDENFEFGVTNALDIDIGDSTLTLLSAFDTPSDSFELMLDADDGDVMSTIQALNSFVSTDLLSSPRLLAVTNTTASIEVIREVPYINVTSTLTGDAGGGIGQQVIEEVQFKEAGVKLSVTPTIEEGGMLHIAIDTELSEVFAFLNGVPAIDRRDLKSEFLVSDRETIVLGGLMQDSMRQDDEGVPGLMDLPLLGRLFRSDTDETETRELIIFLTPRIVSPHEAEGLVDAYSNEYRETLGELGVEPSRFNVPVRPAARPVTPAVTESGADED